MYPDGSPSLRYKRPREEEELPEPVDDWGEDPYEPPEGEGEEDAMSSGSGSTAEAVNNQIAITPFSWSDTTPAEPMTIEVRVLRRTWCWLQTWTLKDVKAMRPCDKKWTKDDQRELLASLKRVLAQPTRVDGEYVYITEKYSPAKNGFPGRLTSAGLQGLQGQIRANLLAETADIDMSMCMHRIVLWVCKQFNIATPQLEYYASGTATDQTACCSMSWSDALGRQTCARAGIRGVDRFSKTAITRRCAVWGCFWGPWASYLAGAQNRLPQRSRKRARQRASRLAVKVT